MSAERGGGDKGAQVALVGVVVEGGWGAMKSIQRYTCWEGEIALVEVVVESEGGARRQIQGYTSCERNYMKMTRRGGRVKGEMVEERQRDAHTHTHTHTQTHNRKYPLLLRLHP